jgi:predicted GH43/DUF377 family glycosyl hydrolase
MPEWIKQGLLFAPPTDLDWMVSHAALPWAEPRGSIQRVYFSGRDQQGRARIGYFELDLRESSRILRVSPRPVLELGRLGAFDDNGITVACLVREGTQRYLYYSGWTLGVTVPFSFYIGLAISDDGETFRRVSEAPVLGRNHHDPFLTASPCVLVENGIWRMWYVSALRWEHLNGQPRHYYLVKYAESRDGIDWRPSGHICIDFQHQGEYAIGRPCVIKDGDRYKMWYSYRGTHYRMGYAESNDGIAWVRKDEQVGIDTSATGWDSEMIEYPYVLDDHNRRYMFYNGNGYGQSGIGMAIYAEETAFQ